MRKNLLTKGILKSLECKAFYSEVFVTKYKILKRYKVFYFKYLYFKKKIIDRSVTPVIELTRGEGNGN